MAISDKHRRVINDAWKQESYVYLTGDSLDIRFQTRIVDMREKHLVLNNSVIPLHLKQFLKSKNFYVQIFLVNFRAFSIDSDGKNILIPLKESLNIKETRQSVRQEFFPHRQEFCKFINPFDNKTVIRKRLMDLSEDGFSLITFVETKLFAIGMKIKDIEFSIGKKGNRVTRSAAVKYIKTLMDINGKCHVQVGFEFLK